MDYRIKDMKNKRFNMLVGLEYVETKTGGAYWLFQCDCGNQKIINGSSVRQGKTTSCGCYAKEVIKRTHTKHGMANTRTYHIWENIKDRCLNPKNKGFKNYGARGITIDDSWHDFENFYKDMGEAPDGLMIDRINNNEGYSKENCQWATRSQQNINKRYVNKTTGIRNISYLSRDDIYEVGFSRNKKRYRKTFKNLEDAKIWKEKMLQKLSSTTIKREG